MAGPMYYAGQAEVLLFQAARVAKQMGLTQLARELEKLAKQVSRKLDALERKYPY